ncbi:MAG: cation:proton antiporter [Collinsella sp.]
MPDHQTRRKKAPLPHPAYLYRAGHAAGRHGPAHIDFSDYALTETVCSTALLFIMFYGGFNTNIDRAKPVAVPAVLLSTLGVVITAGITGVFAHFVLGFDWIGGLLLGSVVASTDAASVFIAARAQPVAGEMAPTRCSRSNRLQRPRRLHAHRRARNPCGRRRR